MIHVQMQISEELARRIQPLKPWLPTVLELGLIGFETAAAAAATEVIRFLSQNPSPEELMAFHASERTQERLRRLLALNEAGMLSEMEQLELDELQQIDHIVMMLKAQVAGELQRN